MAIFKKSKFSEWIPFGNYVFGATEYIVMARKNLDNGILQFKSIKAQTSLYHNRYIPANLIDVKKQWELLNPSNK